MPPEALRRIDTLIQVSVRLAKSAPSGRILLARVANAIDPAWIPRPWGDEIAADLEAATAATRDPLKPRVVERTLRDAWGLPPSNELDDFDPDPVAVTPTSQVHRGVVDGAPVAVKVLRPGIAATVRQDLKLLQGLLVPIGEAFPGLDAGALASEFAEGVLDELDLEHEATAQRRFHRALRDHPLVMVPAPLMRLAHERVLVSEWVEGVPMWSTPDPGAAAARLVLFVLGAARSGMVHADPGPDDALVLADGRLAILDFGAVRAVDPERVAVAAVALEAFVVDDQDEFGKALEQLGWLPASHAPVAIELARDVLAEFAGPDPVRLDSAAVIAARDRLFVQPEQLSQLILAGALPAEDLWPARSITQLFGAIARVGTTGRWRELARAAIRDGWDAGIS